MIHCASTPEGRHFDGNSILQWHMLPAKQTDGRLRYKGILYNDAGSLPDEYIGGLSVRKYFGSHGWRAPGYPDVILLNGKIENIWPYNDNGEVEDFEVTNGILASDPLYKCTRHIVYIGGMDYTNKVPKDTRTKEQKETLEIVTKKMINSYPSIKVIGHNQINYRACPSFNVPEWCREIGIPEENIDNRPLIYSL